jgi:hypothetical protein
LLDAATTLTDDTRVAWYGPAMGARSFLTARLMETGAREQDIADSLEWPGLPRTGSATSWCSG